MGNDQDTEAQYKSFFDHATDDGNSLGFAWNRNFDLHSWLGSLGIDFA